MSKQFNMIEIVDLAAALVDLDPEKDYQDEMVEAMLMDEFTIDFVFLNRLMNKLAPMMNANISPLTDQPFIGFGTKHMWLAKIEFPHFVNLVLNWIGLKELINGKSKAMERVINNGGEPEFRILLLRADQKFKLMDRKEVSDV